MRLVSIATGKVLSVSSGNFPTYLVGTEASKPASPSVGDYYTAVDSGKTYICFVNGVWSLVSSPAEERYENHLGTTDNLAKFETAVTGTAITTAATHRADLATGVTVNATAAYYLNRTINPLNDYFVMNVKIQNSVNGTGAGGGSPSTLETLIGLITNTGSLASYGVYFRRNVTDSGTTWICRNKSAIFGEDDASISAPSNGDILTLVGQKTRIHYLVNGVLVSTGITQISDYSCYPAVIIGVLGNNAVSQGEISIDYIDMKVMS